MREEQAFQGGGLAWEYMQEEASELRGSDQRFVSRKAAFFRYSARYPPA
jgi:hypothetical protein